MNISKGKLLKIIELVKVSPEMDVELLLDIAGVHEEKVVDKPPVKKRAERKFWTDKETNRFIQLVNQETDYDEIARELGRKKASLYTYAFGLRERGLLADNTRKVKQTEYTKEEDNILTNMIITHKEVYHIPNKLINRFAVNSNRTEGAIRTRLYLIKKKLNS